MNQIFKKRFSNQHKSSTKSESSIPVDRLVLQKKGQKRSCTKGSGERGKLTSGFPQVVRRLVVLSLVASVIILAIGVLLTVGNGYHRLLGNQSNTILSQSTGLDAAPDERRVPPILHSMAFGFYFVCIPFLKNLRILFYGRISKDEQRQQSIEDQLQYCKEFLSEAGVDVTSVEMIFDSGISGEVHSRPGIDQVRRGIWDRKWDLIICEDSSRLYRSISPCMDLVGAAVDNDIRVICINDRVDTANDDWQQKLEEAQRHHGQDNFFTRYRIKRTHNGLWEKGAAIGLLRAGYERYQKDPDQHNAPKYDRIDPQWVEAIRTAFEMVADGQSLDTVALHLTEQGVRKTTNAQTEEWTECNVLSLIRCPLYRGEERFRETISRKQYSTGKSKPVKNPDPDKILTRAMPHLRMVEDWLWHKANQAIDQRITRSPHPSGKDHPLSGIPRNSRSPLSNIFVCGICGSKMYMEGRNEGGFRCSAATKGKCWNKTTALRDFSYRQIGVAVSETILKSSDSILEPLTTYIESLLLSPEDVEGLKIRLKRRRSELKRKQENLLRLVMNSDEPLEFVEAKAEELQKQLDTLKLDEQQLESQLSQSRTLPSRDEIADKLQEAAGKVLSMERTSGDVLERILKGPIRAVPCQQFGSNKVVLRAKMTLQLAEFGSQGLGSVYLIVLRVILRNAILIIAR
ncbi:hypothetical protein Pan153_53190 [Gimesia panareensis]|uniref:Recombinase domain-containing protein n=1 Tax=Gimesia panareensis TaxID=2527978 RepID=A0A518FW97_9PLAN|nr:recombinase family protein [Gimesia panareensis]QDV20643.1 hypothetical protein Pan153_53190 [Gimesia panareensis]